LTDGPLVPLLSIEDATEVATKAGLRPEMARINFYRQLLQSPSAGRVECEINDRILWEGVLTRRPEANRLRELAIMRVAWRTGSAYLWAHHFSPTVDKELPGVRPAEVLSVRYATTDERLAPSEQVLFRAVDEMLAADRVSEGTMRSLRSHLESDAELVELVYVIAIWRSLTTLMASFQVPLEDGYSLWEPDGVAP
jgi:alkylhydroperoxidase family enzyme